MSQITVTIDTTDIASIHAFAALAEALYYGEKNQQPITLARGVAPAPVQHSAPAAPIQPTTAAPTPQTIPAYQQPTSTAPTYQPAPLTVPTTTALQPAPPATPATLPTASSTYTLEQLGLAGTQLVDTGRRQELITLLSGFNVQALNQLPLDRYGDFATALRGLGAKI